MAAKKKTAKKKKVEEKQDVWDVNLRCLVRHRMVFEEAITQTELLRRLKEMSDSITDIEGYVDCMDEETLEVEYKGDGVE